LLTKSELENDLENSKDVIEVIVKNSEINDCIKSLTEVCQKQQAFIEYLRNDNAAMRKHNYSIFIITFSFIMYLFFILKLIFDLIA
jgi:hypothetical protein